MSAEQEKQAKSKIGLPPQEGRAKISDEELVRQRMGEPTKPLAQVLADLPGATDIHEIYDGYDKVNVLNCCDNIVVLLQTRELEAHRYACINEKLVSSVLVCAKCRKVLRERKV